MIKTITYECMLISVIYIISVVCKLSISLKPLFQTLHGCSLSLIKYKESAREKVFVEFSGHHWAHAIETFWGILAEHQCINKLKQVKLSSFSRF